MTINDDTAIKTKTIKVAYTEWGEYHYFASFAVSFGYRAIPTTDTTIVVNKIWGDGELWYDRTSGKRKKGVRWYFLPGTEDQMPPDGAEMAYRGQMVLWFSDLDLGADGSLPTISAEFDDGGDVTIAEALTLIAERAGYTEDQIEASPSLSEIALAGYILDGQATLESVATDMAFLYDFNFVEANGKVYFLQSYTDGEFIATVNVVTLAVLKENSDGQQIDPIQIGSDQSLPRTITATYFDIDDQFQQGTQSATRHDDQTASQSDVSIALPVVMGGAEMRSRLLDALARSYDERNGHSLRLPPMYVQLDPADAISFNVYGSDYTGVIAKATLNADWSTSVSLTERGAERHSSDIETQAPATPVPAVTFFPVRLVIMDIPDTAESQTIPDWLNVRIAISAVSLGDWNGASLDMAPSNNMNGWVRAYTQEDDVGIGETTEYPDDDTIKFDIGNFALDRFADATDDEIAAGANTLIVGSAGRFEILQFRHIELSSGIATITGLDRGLFGTDDWQNQHEVGDTVVFFDDTTTVQYSVEDYRNQLSYAVRAVPAFSEIDDLDVVLYTPSGNSRRPYSPDEITVKREINGDLTFAWVRDDRFEGEPDDIYSLDIFNADWSLLVRRATGIPGPTWTYKIEQQTTDDLNLDLVHNVLVFQMNASHVGRGFPGGGAISETVAGIVEGVIGPVGGFRVQSPLTGRLGPVRALKGALAGGRTIVGLAGTIGVVAGPSGVLRLSEWYARFGPVAGPSADLEEITVPTLVRRVAMIVTGAEIETKTLNLGAIHLGDLLMVHDMKYGPASRTMHLRSTLNPKFHHLGTTDQRASSGLWSAVYSYVVTDATDLDNISPNDTTFVDPLDWSFTEVHVFRHINMDDPVGDFGMGHDNADHASHTAPALTTTNDNSLTLFDVGARGNMKSYTGPAGLTHVGYVNSKNDQDTDVSFGGDLGGTLDSAYKVIEASGTTFGPKTFTYSTPRPNVSYSAEINYGISPVESVLPFRIYTSAGTFAGNSSGAIPMPHAVKRGDLVYVFTFRDGSTRGFGLGGEDSLWTQRVALSPTVASMVVSSVRPETDQIAQAISDTNIIFTDDEVAVPSGWVIAIVHNNSDEDNVDGMDGPIVSWTSPDNNHQEIVLDDTLYPLASNDLILSFGAGVNADGPNAFTQTPIGYVVAQNLNGEIGIGVAHKEQMTVNPESEAPEWILITSGRRAGFAVAIRKSHEIHGPTFLKGHIGPVMGFAFEPLETLDLVAAPAMKKMGFEGVLTFPSTAPTAQYDQAQSGSTTLTLNVPTGDVGDLIYTFIFADNTNGPSLDSAPGWTQVTAMGLTVAAFWVHRRTADGSEGSTIAVTFASGVNRRGLIARVTNHGGQDTYSVSGQDNNGNSLTVSALTTTEDGDLVMAFAGGFGDIDVTPTGYDVEEMATSGGNVTAAVADTIQLVGGSSGTFSWHFTGALRRGGVAIAIKPA